MCAALTENVVLTRTRSHDLKSVRKLNCWGCTLKDVSIVQRMPNLEVISLSINSIDTLEYFASCTNLQELYLRKNEIKNINEILHLSQLQFLKKLSLEDNPCTEADNYRLTVLKTLPSLEYLDNLRVTPDDIYEAEKLGLELAWPGSEPDEPEEEVVDLQIKEELITEYSNDSLTHSVPREETHQSLNTSIAQTQNGGNDRYSLNSHDIAYMQTNDIENVTSSSSSSSYHASNTNLATNVGNTTTMCTPSSNGNNRNSIGVPVTYTNGGGNLNGGNRINSSNMAKSNSLSDYNIYNNSNYRNNSSPPPPSSNGNNYDAGNDYRNFEGSGVGHYSVNTNGTFNHNGGTHQNQNGSLSGSNRTIQSSSSSSQSRLLPKGGKNRNANILSAVLCLIKELDYGSLEVVDTTIHCRMEEMED